MRRLLRKSRSRLIRYGLIGVNLVTLLIVVLFVIHNSTYGQAMQHNSVASTDTNAASNPLDQISSADIAVNVAHMTGLPETNAVTNYADSFNVQTAISDSSSTIIAKPQVVSSRVPSRKDIINYVTGTGDTISGLASRFGVTSDSIKNTNGLVGDSLAANQKLLIPPVNGIVYIVQSKDTVATLSQKYSVSQDAITNINDAEVSGITAGEQIIIPDAVIPVARTVSYVPSFGFAFGLTPLYGSNGYDFGWCTWYAAYRRAQLGRPVPSNLGNAATWYILAQRAGLPTGLTPQVGAVAVNQGGDHVMIVEQVNTDGSFWISEMNAGGQKSITDTSPAGGWDRVDYRLISSVGVLKFIY